MIQVVSIAHVVLWHVKVGDACHGCVLVDTSAPQHELEQDAATADSMYDVAWVFNAGNQCWDSRLAWCKVDHITIPYLMECVAS